MRAVASPLVLRPSVRLAVCCSYIPSAPSDVRCAIGAESALMSAEHKLGGAVATADVDERAEDIDDAALLAVGVPALRWATR